MAARGANQLPKHTTTAAPRRRKLMAAAIAVKKNFSYAIATEPALVATRLVVRVQVPAQDVGLDCKRWVPPCAGHSKLHRQPNQPRTFNPQEVFKMPVHSMGNTGAYAPHLDASPLHRVATFMVVPLRVDGETSGRPHEEPSMPYGTLLYESYVVHLLYQ